MSDDSTNMISDFKQILHADIHCPYLTKKTSNINFPCAMLESIIPATYDAQPDRLWTITCPNILWINVRIITLELPLSGPNCTHGYVAFLRLFGEPPHVKYCGRRPQETLYASPKLTILQVITLLRSNFNMQLHYQFIARQAFTIAQRLPSRLNDYILCLNEYLPCTNITTTKQLALLPHHMMYNYGIIKYRIFFTQPLTLQQVSLLLRSHDCDYVVHNGPGIRSPLVASSSTHGSTYLITSVQKVYIEFWGRIENCHNATITSDFGTSLPQQPLNKTSEAALCSNELYEISSSGPYELHIRSSDNNNTWCRISIVNLINDMQDQTWTLSFHMVYSGPTVYLQGNGAEACQYGGIVLNSYTKEHRKYAFCESMSLLPDTLNLKHIKSIHIDFLRWLLLW